MDNECNDDEHSDTKCSWEIVTGKKRPPTPEQTFNKKSKPPTEVSNRYETLRNLSTSDSTESNSTSVKIPPPPPIIVQDVADFPALITFLSNVAGKDNFKLKTSMRGTNIYPANPATYRKCVTALKEAKANFHTYQLQEDKCPRIVIKGLHHSTPPSEIVHSLKELGYEATRVTNVLSYKKQPLPMFFVDISKASYNQNIFDVKIIFYTKIKIEEPRRKKEIVQCTKCQGFNHTKTYCNHPPRCVRCGGNHISGSCGKTRDTPATCANCSQDHPANYKGCQTLKELREARRKVSPSNERDKKQPQAPPELGNREQSFPQLSIPTSLSHLTQTFGGPSQLSRPSQRPLVPPSQPQPAQPSSPQQDQQSSPWRHQMPGMREEVLNIEGPSFNITKVNRLHMGAYLCIASNGVPPSVSKRISLIVHFPPMVWIQNQLVGAVEGDEITLECHSEAYPKSINYWTREKGDIIAHGAKYEPVLVDNAYKVHMKLTIRHITEADFGSYKCVAKNSLGDTDGTIKLYSITPATNRPKHKDRGRNRKYGPNDIDPGLSAKQRELKQGRYDDELDKSKGSVQRPLLLWVLPLAGVFLLVCH